ncbi:MAG: DUF1997 domain-containing protein [Cyanobacteria bacterium]|nr:DUF1997 domain-containing protein [Cyanobacteriota bacterium]
MADQPPLLRRRAINLPIPGPPASRERLQAYLALVDRPLTALLARERLQIVAPGQFTYRSNPYQILHWQVVPTLNLQAGWEADQLEVRSTSCRLVGLRDSMESLGFTLEAVLTAEEKVLNGWAEVGLQSRLVASPIGRRVGTLALERVLDRIERRVGRGLRRDLGAWLGQGANASIAGVS